MNITKDKIAKWLNDNGYEVDGEKYTNDHYFVEVFHDCIQDLAPKWVSVDDRLPEHDTLVVASHLYEYCTDLDAAVCCFFNGEFLLHKDGLEASNYDGGATIKIDMDITHWMPLPEPPK